MPALSIPMRVSVFVGAIPAAAPRSEAASAFVAFLKSASVLAAIRAKGMQVD